MTEVCDPANGEQHKGRVLVIAGSDPSGGAGIQADIKTITALGGYAATAITALTVQNTMGVTDVMSVASDFVANQMKAVLTDVGADAVKTGMLHDIGTIEAVVESLNAFTFQGAVVVDPVMVATSGDHLLKPEAVKTIVSCLLPRATVITPNIPEAEVLAGFNIDTVDGIRRAGKRLLSLGPKAVLRKGWPLTTEKLVAILLTQDGEAIQIKSIRLDTRHNH
ncbi:MAG: bifunctional hydroxymethylpyrimidine kinase/phosphomethylpyrimidine kinase, partial [Kordiimonas sp.]